MTNQAKYDLETEIFTMLLLGMLLAAILISFNKDHKQ